ncbi:uncharacterized protein CcaverHIS019_0601250 [Cutaneotrichosporon cavernicola]|uniref:Fibronectin type-III domain-containing protein n=1 Tax=Cutaneotrichosporon cavernicola TaxID=279322 RepID=A0AA48L7S4_9TREE|nr:uncharacterized protein CcaverHIS019_0601250 [Cutaneotrichosporon cavernicola]BEI93666.1 hypothetical protein CcaverHIS019_0601250 [Cutaneotrichosporon cavernicola]BEJ09210.1 hypothetical protein CcaverHIS641_0601250 [Cutaneotrichosporon cavernicola]
MVVWAALAATFVASALALTPNITTEFFITSMSPMVKFEPPGSWIDTYSNFDDSLYEPGVIEAGYPMLFAPHGGRASISYVGTNVTWIAVMPVGADSTVVSPEVDGTAQPAPFMDTMIGGRRVVRWTSNPDIPMGPHTGSFGLTANAPPEAQVELVPVNATFNSYRRYTAVNQTMYLSALDPEVNYTVTITGDEDPTQFLGLTTLTACFLKNPTPEAFVVDATGEAATPYTNGYRGYDPSAYAPGVAQGPMGTPGPSDHRPSQGHFHTM